MFLFPLIKLYFALALVLFIPGYFLLLAIFGKNKASLHPLEKLVLSFGLSIASTNFLLILANFLNIPLTRISVFLILSVFSLTCFLIYKKRDLSQEPTDHRLKTKDYSYRKILVFTAILLLALSIRGLYLSRGIMPQTTDWGHHLYWSKSIVQTGQLPSYGMPDFIIGEHIIFAVISLLSGIPFLSSMPAISLLTVNIFSLLAVFLLTQEVFKRHLLTTNYSLLTIFVIGALYAASSPQAKFVSGGVVGNIIGNFYIPLLLYLLIKIIQTKNAKNLASLFLICAACLAYTHHLSTFVFLFIVTAAVVTISIFGLINPKNLWQTIKSTITPFLSPLNLSIIVLFFGFLFFVWMPSYVNPSAIDTAVGTPSKSTRTGFPINQLIQSVGPWIAFYGFVGAVILFFKITINRRRPNGPSLPAIILIAWAGIIFLMSNQPDLLKIDIPSNRIVSYLSYPLSILAAFAAGSIIFYSQKKLPKQLWILVTLMIVGTGLLSGMGDISESARGKEKGYEKEVMQTYLAAQYLNNKTYPDVMVLKDHIYLPGDTWMKLFFMRGYKYPLSRSLLKRYNDPTKNRETCTRDMVAIPDSTIGQECFEETNTEFIVLKNGYDTAQFEKSENFSRIYASDSVAVFQRN